MAQAKTTRRPRAKPGVKRERILEVAIDLFGRYGYEDAKWADVASAVDIGPTALYHYFESKQHCLFEIMGQTVADFQARFDRITAAHADAGTRRSSSCSWTRSTSPSRRCSATAS